MISGFRTVPRRQGHHQDQGDEAGGEHRAGARAEGEGGDGEQRPDGEGRQDDQGGHAAGREEGEAGRQGGGDGDHQAGGPEFGCGDVHRPWLRENRRRGTQPKML